MLAYPWSSVIVKAVDNATTQRKAMPVKCEYSHLLPIDIDAESTSTRVAAELNARHTLDDAINGSWLAHDLAP